MTTDSIIKAYIFCNGELKDPARVKRAARDCDLLIAADGGAKHLADLGLRPRTIIGDMDSIAANLWNDEKSITRIPYSPDKNKSDVELAIEYALEQRCQEIILAAAVGGRLDHTLGNIALVANYPGRIAILDGASTLVAVDKSEKCVLHGQIGTRVSLIPYGSGRPKVRTKGLKYALEDEPLAFVTQGLSNELSQTEACVCLSEGILLVYIDAGQVYPDSQYDIEEES